MRLWRPQDTTPIEEQKEWMGGLKHRAPQEADLMKTCSFAIVANSATTIKAIQAFDRANTGETINPRLMADHFDRLQREDGSAYHVLHSRYVSQYSTFTKDDWEAFLPVLRYALSLGAVIKCDLVINQEHAWPHYMDIWWTRDRLSLRSHWDMVEPELVKDTWWRSLLGVAFFGVWYHPDLMVGGIAR